MPSPGAAQKRKRMELLPGEDVAAKALGVALMRGGGPVSAKGSSSAAVYVTNFRVVIAEVGGEIISAPISRIAALEDRGKMAGREGAGTGVSSLNLRLKDLRDFTLVFPAGHAQGSRAIFDAIYGRWSAPSSKGAFAFSSLEQAEQRQRQAGGGGGGGGFRAQMEAEAAGEQASWYALDVHADFARLGVPNRHWKLSQANASYGLCPTCVLPPPRQR